MELDSDDYTAVPLTLLDATVGNAEIVARASLTLNKPLSFEKLRESWYRTLAARPIMQARVRRSATAPSGLEYHVLTPKGMRKYLERQQDQSTTDHLRDFFCLDESHRSIADYCPGLGIGTESAQTSEKRGIFVSDNADEQDQERCTAYNGIKSLQELLTSDRPIATIQVTRFSDATLISISVSHIIGDLFTIKALFKSWETALHGDIVEPFDSAELGVDPFANYGPGGLYADTIVPGEELPSGWRVYGGLDKARLISRVLWDQKVTRPEKTISQKYIYIPEEEVRGLLEDARADLAKIYPDETSRPTLSRSNVIYAWILKHTHAHLSPSKSHKSTPVAIANARGRPPTGLTPRSPASSSTTTKEDFPSHDFYGAALLTALPSLPIQAIQTLPLGQLSLYVRQGLTEATSPENTRKWLSFNLANNLYKSPTGKFAFWSPPDHYWVGLSDWRLIKLQEVDFSPAFSTDGAGGTVSVTGFNSHMVMSGSQRNRWVCLGEAGGGVWILGITGESEWRDQRGWGRYPRLTRRKKRASKL
ncbi:hypothetical protein BJY04DRAFT_212727 [Aspergillus karnatakaensis]|uniref:uncharacterized protein n=1 Tax=Aspergillus karnatakaensis TaxID=1810916 RepID=UPI003CCE2678